MEHDTVITVVPVEPVSRPMKPISKDHVLKSCGACKVQLVILAGINACPLCSTPLTVQEKT